MMCGLEIVCGDGLVEDPEELAFDFQFFSSQVTSRWGPPWQTWRLAPEEQVRLATGKSSTGQAYECGRRRRRIPTPPFR